MLQIYAMHAHLHMCMDTCHKHVHGHLHVYVHVHVHVCPTIILYVHNHLQYVQIYAQYNLIDDRHQG